MGIVEDLADELAVDALETSIRLENEKIVLEVSEILGASSTTAQEAFLTAVRVRRAEARARKYLEECKAKAPESK